MACKASNELEAERTKFRADGAFQNPAKFSARTRTFIAYHELVDEKDQPRWIFVKRQCMHCAKMPCAVSCPPKIFRRDESGAILIEVENCIGCGACVASCPFSVPAMDYWDVPIPRMLKCTFCVQRREAATDDLRINGRRPERDSVTRHKESFRMPACAKACPTDTIQFGRRDALLVEARRRMALEPARYVDHIYGETELGGFGWLYLAAVPFDQLGFPTRFVEMDEFQILG